MNETLTNASADLMTLISDRIVSNRFNSQNATSCRSSQSLRCQRTPGWGWPEEAGVPVHPEKYTQAPSHPRLREVSREKKNHRLRFTDGRNRHAETAVRRSKQQISQNLLLWRWSEKSQGEDYKESRLNLWRETQRATKCLWAISSDL